VQADGSTVSESSELQAACAVLGLSDAPSVSEARAAFRDRAALLHPDVHQSAGTHRMKAATEAMLQLNDAYQLLLESLVAADRETRRGRSSKPASYPPRRRRAGRTVVTVRRGTTPRRTTPLGRLQHLSLWLGEG
jgi:hypothetical protein